MHYTTALLDKMRTVGDPVADAAYAKMVAAGDTKSVNEAFKHMARNEDRPTSNPGLRESLRYFDATDKLPPDMDRARILRGEAVATKHGLVGTLVMLCKSLPLGYQMPNLTKVLAMSGNLEKKTLPRLLGVLQMVIDVSTPGGFEEGGAAVITAQKLRLLHAGVRAIVRTQMPGYEQQYGVPVCQEDMLATLLTFSYLVIEGLDQLGSDVSSEEAEDYLYLWMAFGEMTGLRRQWLPTTVAEARQFYLAYERRHAVAADKNPDGVRLAAANLAMARTMLPDLIEDTGIGDAPRIYMVHLMGETRAANVGIAPVDGDVVFKGVLRLLPKLEGESWGIFDPLATLLHAKITRGLLGHLIRADYDGKPAFMMPATLQDLWTITDRDRVEEN